MTGCGSGGPNDGHIIANNCPLLGKFVFMRCVAMPPRFPYQLPAGSFPLFLDFNFPPAHAGEGIRVLALPHGESGIFQHPFSISFAIWTDGRFRVAAGAGMPIPPATQEPQPGGGQKGPPLRRSRGFGGVRSAIHF